MLYHRERPQKELQLWHFKGEYVRRRADKTCGTTTTRPQHSLGPGSAALKIVIVNIEIVHACNHGYTHAQFQCLRFENGFHQYRTVTEDMTGNDGFSDLEEDLYNLDRNFNELVSAGLRYVEARFLCQCRGP